MGAGFDSRIVASPFTSNLERDSMTELTLNAVKAENAAEIAARMAETRARDKKSALNRLAAAESRLGNCITNLTERRKALKTQKITAEAFLQTIESRADEADLELEEIETLLRTIENSFPANGCAAAPAQAPVSKAEFVTVSLEQLDTLIAAGIRDNVTSTAIRRGSRAGSRG